MVRVEERLAEYLTYKKVKLGTAEKACGISNGLLSKAIKAGSSLGSDKLANILNVYSDLSAEWLFRGTGSMILADSDEKSEADIADDRIARLQDRVELLERWMNVMQKFDERDKK